MAFKSIDLFSGAGGLTLGLAKAGFTTIFATDYDENVSQTFKKNFQNVEFLCKNITDINFKSLKNNLSIMPGELDLIVGGPPCQGFSMANRKKIDNDPRNLLFRSFVRAVEVFRPKCFLIENVTGINSEVINFEKKNISVTTAITEYFDSIGYTVKFLKFSSEEFGVPQIRKRVLIIGTNIEEKKQLIINSKNFNISGDFMSASELKAQNQNQFNLFQNSKKSINVWNSLSDLPKLNAGEDGNGKPYLHEPQNEYQLLMRQDTNGVFNHKSTPHDNKAIERIKLIKQGQNFDYLIVNDKFEEALADLKSIIISNKELTGERKELVNFCLKGLLEE